MRVTEERFRTPNGRVWCWVCGAQKVEDAGIVIVQVYDLWSDWPFSYACCWVCQEGSGSATRTVLRTLLQHKLSPAHELEIRACLAELEGAAS